MELSSVFCILLAFVVNYNTIDSGFVYDDSRAILSNSDILSSTPVSNIWMNDFWGTPLNSTNSHGSYRPICILTFRLNYWISGFKSWSYHLVNVVLHSVMTYLVLVLGKYIISEPANTTAAMIFAVHPIHCEAVASVVGRAELLSGIFFIASFLCYVGHVNIRNKEKSFEKIICNGNVENTHEYYSMEYKCKVYSIFSSCRKLTKFSILNNYPHVLINNYVKYREWVLLIASVVLATFAMLSKESGITIIAVCMVYDYIKTRRLHNQKLYKSLSIMALAGIFIILIRMQIMGNNSTPIFASCDNPTSKSKSVITRSLTFLYLPVFNFLLLLYPLSLSFDWSMDAIPRISNFFDYRNVASFIFYFALIYLVKCYIFNWTDHFKMASSSSSYKMAKCKTCKSVSSLRHTPKCRQNNNNNVTRICNCLVASKRNMNDDDDYYYNVMTTERCIISLTLMAIPFIPASNLFFYVGFVVAERVLYIPSIGYCFFLSLAYHHYQKRTKLFKLFRLSMVFLIMMFSFRTILRNSDWQNEESLYRSGIHINPPKAYANLGSILSSQGKIEEAEVALKTALKYRPNMADAHYNLGILLQGKARYIEAINSYKMAIHYRPSLALAHLNLGQLLVSQGRCEEAEEVLRRCARLNSTGLKDVQTHENTRITALLHLGRLLADRGHYSEAVSTYREAIQSLPKHYQPQILYNLLGEALTQLGEHEEAERWHKAAIRAKPDHIPGHLIYGKLLAKNRTRVGEAEKWFLKAEKLAPRDPTVHQHFGQFLSQNERHSEAAKQYVEAVKLSPMNYELVVSAATALRMAGDMQQAEEMYHKAAYLRPDEIGSHINLGAILHLNGKYKEAIVSYQKALKIDARDEMALENLNKLRMVMRKSKSTN